MNSKAAAIAAGAVGGSVALAILVALGASRYPVGYQQAIGVAAFGRLRTALLLTNAVTALRVGLATGFNVRVCRAGMYRGFDRLTWAAVAGLSWILVAGFVQDVLLDLHDNLSTWPANLFWAGAFVASAAALIAFVARAAGRVDSSRS